MSSTQTARRKRLYVALLVTALILELGFFSVSGAPSACTNLTFTSTNDLPIIDFSRDISLEPSGYFIKNCGQLDDPAIRYYSQNGNVWFTDNAIWYRIEEAKETKKAFEDDPAIPINVKDMGTATERGVVLKQEFSGAGVTEPVGREKQDTYLNFFYGNDPAKWMSNVPVFKEIYFPEIYNDIDLRYYKTGNELKYDLILHQGADVNQIKIKYEGANELRIMDHDVIISTAHGNIVDSGLYIYQDMGNVRTRINGRFVQTDGSEYGFEISSEFDKNEILVIDPNIKLDYSTYLGGSNYDGAESMAVDIDGNTFVTGSTKSPYFPTTPGAYNRSYNNDYDIFITKLDPSASNLIFSTYIGGPYSDHSEDIEIDQYGNSYVTGSTYSPDFPTTNGAYDTGHNGAGDAFILKMNHNGTELSYSTFIGGSSVESGNDLELDGKGYIYLTGRTSSSTFPTTPGAYDEFFNSGTDCFVLKMNLSTSSLTYSTFIGGSKTEEGYNIEIDSTGSAYVAGFTYSDIDFPITTGVINETFNGGSYDIFVFKLNVLGSDLIYSTYIGGSNLEQAQGLEIDSMGNAYVTGWTRSPDFPTTAGANDSTYDGNDDGVVFKLNHNGTELLYSTFIGGTEKDWANDIAIDPSGTVYITGETRSNDFPVTPGSYDEGFNDGSDAFLLGLSYDFTSIDYSTYFGGTSYESGNTIIFDAKGDAYIAGRTMSIDFPITMGVINGTLNGDFDAFITKFSLSPSLKIASLDILSNGESAHKVYAKYGIYDFKVIAIDVASANQIKDVVLTLDPVGSDIQLVWNRTSDQFSKMNDPDNFIILDQTSNSQRYFNIWTLNFNVIFNWTYNDEELNDVQIYATSDTLATAWYNVTDLYQAENDLVFLGALRVTGDGERLIKDNELVRGGEELTWTGIMPVYENTENVYPPGDEFDITIWDGDDNYWSFSPGSGKNLTGQTETPLKHNISDFTYKINISGIPPECDLTSMTFTVKIDSDQVVFTEPLPGEHVWQTTRNVNVGVTITDIGGGIVNGSSIMRSTSTDNGSTWSDWLSCDSVQSSISLEISDLVSLKEGTNNLIRWQAEDSVRNGPSISQNYRILIDTENVTFDNAIPGYTRESPKETVEVGITVMDNGSGVNASTIEFTISYDEGKAWSPWSAVSDYTNGNAVNVKVNVTFKNGTGNRIMWRAYDLAGNGPAISEQYIVRVNTWLDTLVPKVKLQAPEDGATVSSNSVELKWVLLNADLVDVAYDIYLDITDPPIELEKIDYPGTSIRLENLTDKVEYFWTIVPRTGTTTGTCLSGIWSFKVDLDVLVPEVKLILPENGLRLNALRPIFTWELIYNGTGAVLYDIYLDNEIPPKRLIEGYPLTEYTPGEDLEDGMKYFWSILPKAGEIIGLKTETRWFEIDIDYEPNIDFKLSLIPNALELEQGTQGSLKISVTNLGEMKDVFYLDHDVPLLSGVSIDINDTGLLIIEPQDTAYFEIIVNVDEKARPGEVFVVFTGTSGRSIDYGDELEKTATLKINIIKTDEDSTEKGLSNIMLASIILVIIICIIIALFLIITAKRRKRITAEVEYIPPGTGPALPGGVTDQAEAISGPVAAVQVQPAVTSDEMLGPPGVEAIPSTTQPAAGAGAGAGTTTTTTSPQAFMPPRPQLPPSEEAEKSAGPGLSTESGQEPGEVPIPAPAPEPTKLLESDPSSRMEKEKIDQIFTFGTEEGPRPVQEEDVSHDASEPERAEAPDLSAPTEDLHTTGSQDLRQKVLIQIEKLGELKERGLLTEEEFLTRKQELLKKI